MQNKYGRQVSSRVRKIFEEEESTAQEESTTPDFTQEELQLIADRIWVETEWGEGVYDSSYMELMESILNKLKEKGIEAK